MLIFLEGMFREPRSPRGKDNAGCDVTSILGKSGGKRKILGGLEEFRNAFPHGISHFNSTLHKQDLKWLPTSACAQYVHPHLHASPPHSSRPQAMLTVCSAKKQLPPFNVPPLEFQGARRNTGVGEA